ncbi:MAG: hypothetical protein WA734_03945 [Candidatus Acidiferrales bacterium]
MLNLGAGVQSTTIYLMYVRGVLKPQIDCAIFADTQDEPVAVYRHLQWLQSLGGPTIHVRTKGKLSDHLKRGVNSTGGRFASIPAFTLNAAGAIGAVQRQCSKEYKTEVIDRFIRRELLGLKPRARVPKGTEVIQIFGISLDEAGRSVRIRERLREHKWITTHFPLITELFYTRSLCETWLLGENIPHKVPRSACVFCPYHSDAEWSAIKQIPEDWEQAVEVDEALRQPVSVPLSRRLDAKVFLHRSCQPLVQIQFNGNPNPRELQMPMNFFRECEGVCGV